MSRAQGGWSVIELLVVSVIFLIAVGIAVPQFNGQKKNANSAEARNLIQQAYESSQDYFAGEGNPNVSGTYAGITAGILDGIQPDIDWKVSGTALSVGASANPRVVVVVSAPSSPTDQTTPFTLCNAAFSYVYCVVDDGSGPRYGADSSMAAAQTNATKTTATALRCQEQPRFAENSAC